MADPTEATCREMAESGPPQADLVADTGQRWTTEQLRADFEFQAFAAPFVVVVHKSDGAHGTLEFARGPDGERYYFGWAEA